MKDNRIGNKELLVARSDILHLKSQSVNTRKLNQVSSTKVSILYMLDYWSMLH